MRNNDTVHIKCWMVLGTQEMLEIFQILLLRCAPSGPFMLLPGSDFLLFISLKKNIYLLIYGCAGSLLLLELSLVAASGGHSLVVVYGFGCSTACGIFPDQGSSTCLLH